MKKDRVWNYARWGLCLCLFGIFLAWSMMQPFGAPPDEAERYKITAYIVKHGTLPHGGDPEIMLDGWGFSYGFQPILPYILSAYFVRFVSLFTSSEYVILIAARMVSVMTGVVMAAIVWKLSEKLFREKSTALLFAFLVCLLPQCMFMHTYVNVDSMALMSSALIVYSWVIGLESGWNTKSCCFLGVGMGLCAMSYYDAYGFLLCSIFAFLSSFIHYDRREKKLRIEWKELLKKGFLAGGIAFLIAGWWFIRSAVLYDGDFLGLRTRDAYAEKYAAKHLKPSMAPTWHNAGFSIIDMLRQSDYLNLLTKSFVGMFEHMKLPLPDWMYRIYFAVLGLGLLFAVLPMRKRKALKLQKKRIVFHMSMIACILIPNWLCLWAAYDVDYQPQGRYILPMIIPFMYYVTLGFRKLLNPLFEGGHEKAANGILYGLCALLAVVMLLMLWKVIYTKYYYNFITMLKSDWRTFFRKKNRTMSIYHRHKNNFRIFRKNKNII